MSEAGPPPLIIDCVIPALDEEGAIGGVVRAIPRELHGAAAIRGGAPDRPWKAIVRRVIVVDNGSRDRTAEVARAAGAEVVREGRRGYGAACLAGIAALGQPRDDPPDLVAFLDGDHADDPRELGRLVDALACGADLVIGSRTLRGDATVTVERGALTPQQRAGNAVAAALIRALYRQRCTDLGPFRLIRFPSLHSLGMRDLDYGWTAEMQVRALARGLRVREVPVSSLRRRAGRSKVSATVRGTIGAGWKILYTVVRHAAR